MAKLQNVAKAGSADAILRINFSEFGKPDNTITSCMQTAEMLPVHLTEATPVPTDGGTKAR